MLLNVVHAKGYQMLLHVSIWSAFVQSITLEYRMDQTVATADTPPVVLGRMPAHFAESMGAALRHVALQHIV